MTMGSGNSERIDDALGPDELHDYVFGDEALVRQYPKELAQGVGACDDLVASARDVLAAMGLLQTGVVGLAHVRSSIGNVPRVAGGRKEE